MCLVIYIHCQLQYCACLTCVHLVPKEYNFKIIALFFCRRGKQLLQKKCYMFVIKSLCHTGTGETIDSGRGLSTDVSPAVSFDHLSSHSCLSTSPVSQPLLQNQKDNPGMKHYLYVTSLYKEY